MLQSDSNNSAGSRRRLANRRSLGRSVGRSPECRAPSASARPIRRHRGRTIMTAALIVGRRADLITAPTFRRSKVARTNTPARRTGGLTVRAGREQTSAVCQETAGHSSRLWRVCSAVAAPAIESAPGQARLAADRRAGGLRASARRAQSAASEASSRLVKTAPEFGQFVRRRRRPDARRATRCGCGRRAELNRRPNGTEPSADRSAGGRRVTERGENIAQRGSVSLRAADKWAPHILFASCNKARLGRRRTIAPRKATQS